MEQSVGLLQRTKISLVLRDVPIRDALHHIAQKAGLTLSWNQTDVPLTGRISISVTDETAQHVFEQVLRNTNAEVVVAALEPQRTRKLEMGSGLTDELGLPVRYLVYTDHHPDHTTGSHWLPGTVVAHEGTRTALAAGAPGYLDAALSRVDPEGAATLAAADWAPRLPELTFSERLSLHVGGVTFELIHLAGHTGSTIAVHLPRERIVFSGDNVLTLDGVPGLGELCLHEHLATFDALEALDYDVLVPGHGPVAGPAALASYRARLGAVIGDVQAAIDAGATLEQMLARVSYRDLHADDPANGDPGYEPADVAWFQRSSLTNVYRQLLRRPMDRRRWCCADAPSPAP